MNTQTQVHRLEAGQALLVSSRSTKPAVLVKGEVLVQAPARWLGGSVVLSPATRLLAPAVLPSDPSASVVAVHESTVIVEEAPSLLDRVGQLLRNWPSGRPQRAASC